ncbi:MAG: DUF2293 domain-containing protein [Pirellulaceae bacterium]
MPESSSPKASSPKASSPNRSEPRAGQARNVAPGPTPRTVRTEQGEVVDVPADWELLPPGDAALTRRVKAAGPTWTVRQKKGRRMFSLGVWAPTKMIEALRTELLAERATESYARRRVNDAARRQREQSAYVEDFHAAVLAFLDFDPRHRDLARRLADAVTRHATPVGSGTVARTRRIPIERRAESAVIAWLRHQTTAYDDLAIPRIKGKRREVRRMLAEQSRRLLEVYRDGRDPGPRCPLRQGLRKATADANNPPTVE